MAIDSIFDIDEFEEESIKYGLRPQARTGAFPLTTYIDEDKSGNYDPIQERKKTSTKRKRSSTDTVKSKSDALVLRRPSGGLQKVGYVNGHQWNAPIPIHSTSFYIHTAFCHPMTFNCEISDHQFSDPFRVCDLCRTTDFAITGHGFVDVKVQENPSKLCYEERGRSGHWEKGRLPTRICAKCTMRRFSIASCPHNLIEPLPLDQIAEVQDAYFTFEQAPDHGAMCSICPSPIASRCKDPVAVNDFGAPLDEIKFGCGLVLCQFCATALRERFLGDLSKMVKASLRDKENYRSGLRADAELLTNDGLLVRNVLADIS